MHVYQHLSPVCPQCVFGRSLRIASPDRAAQREGRGVGARDDIIHIRIADDRQNRPERLLVHNGGAFLDIPHYCQRNKIARTFGHVATCDELAARTCALQIAEYLVILRLVLDWPELRLRITATRYLRSSGISDDLLAHRVITAVENIEPLDDRTNLASVE